MPYSKLKYGGLVLRQGNVIGIANINKVKSSATRKCQSIQYLESMVQENEAILPLSLAMRSIAIVIYLQKKWNCLTSIFQSRRGRI